MYPLVCVKIIRVIIGQKHRLGVFRNWGEEMDLIEINEERKLHNEELHDITGMINQGGWDVKVSRKRERWQIRTKIIFASTEKIVLHYV